MKAFIVLLTLASSLTALAAELPVMEVKSADVRGSSLSTRFEVNLQDGTAGISLTARKSVQRGRGQHHIVSKTYEKLVPELALVNDKLMLGDVECGTMGETRIFKRPVLNLSGKCDVVAIRSGSVVKVSIVTE